MTAILRNVPFFENQTHVFTPTIRVPVKGHQIITWVSITPGGPGQVGPSSARFPAILDTGNNFTYSIRESQLRQWAGIDLRTLARIRSMRQRGRLLPVFWAVLWMHRNDPGQRDMFTNQPPFRLELSSGIAIYPNDFPDAPRLPLLGLRALRENRLHLRVDAERRLVSLRSPDWRTWLGPWLR
jgi:hypothetical protein